MTATLRDANAYTPIAGMEDSTDEALSATEPFFILMVCPDC